MPVPVLRATAAAVILGSIACGSAQRAASRDPMRCERDPSCKGHEGYRDCSFQCSDDPPCMDRCREMEEGDRLGHP